MERSSYTKSDMLRTLYKHGTMFIVMGFVMVMASRRIGSEFMFVVAASCRLVGACAVAYYLLQRERDDEETGTLATAITLFVIFGAIGTLFHVVTVGF